MMVRAQLTQADIARALGLSQAQISERLRGITEWRLTELFALADAVGCDLPALIAAVQHVTAEQVPA